MLSRTHADISELRGEDGRYKGSGNGRGACNIYRNYEHKPDDLQLRLFTAHRKNNHFQWIGGYGYSTGAGAGRGECYGACSSTGEGDG